MLLGGCADALKQEATKQAQRAQGTSTAESTGQTGTTSVSASHPSVEPARCPPDLAGCRTASGEILYVEAVDPDGDGDAHFVLISKQSISLPGVSVIDVERDLRPHPLPGVGDWVSAAGPGYPGSHGQQQIEAVDLHTSIEPR